MNIHIKMHTFLFVIILLSACYIRESIQQSTGFSPTSRSTATTPQSEPNIDDSSATTLGNNSIFDLLSGLLNNASTSTSISNSSPDIVTKSTSDFNSNTPEAPYVSYTTSNTEELIKDSTIEESTTVTVTQRNAATEISEPACRQCPRIFCPYNAIAYQPSGRCACLRCICRRRYCPRIWCPYGYILVRRQVCECPTCMLYFEYFSYF